MYSFFRRLRGGGGEAWNHLLKGTLARVRQGLIPHKAGCCCGVLCQANDGTNEGLWVNHQTPVLPKRCQG